MQISIDHSHAFPLAVLTMHDETARIQRGSMVYHSENVSLKARLNGKGVFGALAKGLANEDTLITKVESNGVGQIALSNNFPGDVASLDCQNTQYLINDGCFLAASGVNYM